MFGVNLAKLRLVGWTLELKVCKRLYLLHIFKYVIMEKVKDHPTIFIRQSVFNTVGPDFCKKLKTDFWEIFGQNRRYVSKLF